MEILRARGLTKRFGAQVAVDQVDFVLNENEVAGIIGSNGSGKTTLFNLLTGYHAPEEGTILYAGRDITRASPQQRVAAGLTRTFQLASTFENLSVADNLVLAYFRARRKSSLLHLLLASRRREREAPEIAAVVESFDLGGIFDRQVRHLGLGEKRRLEIAMAVLAEPRVLLLDEPLAGLSETEIAEVLDVLRRRAGRLTVLIVEHKLSHVKGFVQRLAVMHAGRVIAEGDPEACLRNPEVRRSYWQIEEPRSAA